MDFLVVILDVVLNSFKKFKTIIARVEVNVVVLEAFPEAFDPGVVGCSTLSVHRYLDASAAQELCPQGTGVLGALVRVNNLRTSIVVDSRLEYLHTPGSLQRVAQPPGQYFSAIHIHDGSQIHESLSHGDVGDVRTPYLIRSIDG